MTSIKKENTIKIDENINLPPKIRLGILGGGQLGLMLVEAARPLGIYTIIVDPSLTCSAHNAADEHIIGSFTDAEVIANLASRVDVLTVEIEHVDAKALQNVHDAGILVHPYPKTIALVQDKYAQKIAMQKANIPMGEFCAVSNVDDIITISKEWGFPLMLKAKRLAYDGRGNYVVKNAEDANIAWSTLAAAGELYVERWIPYVRELSVLVVRNRNGHVSEYCPVSTTQKNNICHVVVAPAQCTVSVANEARRVALDAVSNLHGAGVFGVEMFETREGNVLFNEIAPRVHNSGHLTIEACHIGQFEAHVRAVCGIPIPQNGLDMRVPVAAMLNILGASDNSEESTWAPCARALSVPGASIHWYNKGAARAGRKMGHITVTGDTISDVSMRLNLITNDTSTEASFSVRKPLVGIIMGSDSDLPTLAPAAKTLTDFNVPFELTVVSAHRTPDRMYEYAKSARSRGLQVIIAAAGGAAHLPGMVAALTSLPVVGVPVPLKQLDGVDSLHSIVQMPRGVPVATVAIGNAVNSALYVLMMFNYFSFEFSLSLLF